MGKTKEIKYEGMD